MISHQAFSKKLVHGSCLELSGHRSARRGYTSPWTHANRVAWRSLAVHCTAIRGRLAPWHRSMDSHDPHRGDRSSELLGLVGSEIGAKTKKPRGQTGAIIGLALVFVYVGARATLHSNVLALMGSRTFHGETLRRAWAYPESLSLFTWHGVAETESALNEIDVNAASASDFDPDSSLRLFKPETSPALEAARNTSAARRFLATAQIPKASMEKTETGYIVIVRDLRYAAAGDTKYEVAARIELDPNSKVASQELVWAKDMHK